MVYTFPNPKCVCSCQIHQDIVVLVLSGDPNGFNWSEAKATYQSKKLIPIVLAPAIWGHCWSGKSVRVLWDKMAAVAQLTIIHVEIQAWAISSC